MPGMTKSVMTAEDWPAFSKAKASSPEAAVSAS